MAIGHKNFPLFISLGEEEENKRRTDQHESSIDVAAKALAARAEGLGVILCLGESLETRDAGDALSFVLAQLAESLPEGAGADWLSIAYEPIWAISSGDGKAPAADPDTVKAVVSVIRNTVKELYGEKAEQNLRVLYGGSSNPDNITGYMNVEGVDGVLPGGASMNYKQFASMIEKAHNI